MSLPVFMYGAYSPKKCEVAQKRHLLAHPTPVISIPESGAHGTPITCLLNELNSSGCLIGLFTFSLRRRLRKNTPSPLQRKSCSIMDLMSGIFTPCPPRMIFECCEI